MGGWSIRLHNAVGVFSNLAGGGVDMGNELTETDIKDLLTAYAETCRHIEQLERIQMESLQKEVSQLVFTHEAKKRADLLLERILERNGNEREI